LIYFASLKISEELMGDGFPRVVAVALGIALAFCVALFALAAMGGWL
jgi:hypothetical protein